MAKPVAPRDMTPDTTIEEIWEGFFTQVLKGVERGSVEYEDSKALFIAGATGALGWLSVAMPNVPQDVALKLIQREAELNDMLDRFIAKRRAEEEAGYRQTV